MAVFRVEKNANYTTMANYHFMDNSLSWQAKGILSNMLSLPESWDYSLAGLATLSCNGMSSTRSAIKELEQHGYLIRKPLKENGKIVDWEYIIFEKPVVGFPQVEKPQVEKPQVENRTQLSTKESTTKKSSTKRKERKVGYDAILSEIEDDSLRETYLEYIKMRKLIKAPMTDRALELLISKVNNLEPNNVERQKMLLNTAITNNWKSVYPLREDTYGRKEKLPGWFQSTQLGDAELEAIQQVLTPEERAEAEQLRKELQDSFGKGG